MLERLIVLKTMSVSAGGMWSAIVGIGDLGLWFPVKRYVGSLEISEAADGVSVPGWVVELEAENQELLKFVCQAASVGVAGLGWDLLGLEAS